MEKSTPPAIPEPVPASMPATTVPSSRIETAKPADTSSSTEDEDTQNLGPRALALMIGALLLVVLVITLDSSIIATAIPKITDHFHTIADIGWYSSAYMITNASLQPLTGKAYTYFSLKYVFLWFIVLFEVGSVICALASSSTMLVVGRAVAGLGASGIMNGALTIIHVASPPSQKPTILGIIVSFAGAGQLIGPLVGGALTEHVTWRWCFWINLPVGGVAMLALAVIQFPPYKSRKAKWTLRDVVHDFDIIGFILFAPACIMLLLALEWGGTVHPWSSAIIIGLFCGSGGTFIAFILWEYRHGEDAMIPVSLVRNRVVYSSMLTAGLMFGGVLMLSYYLPLWFQVIKAASPTLSAVYILPTFVTQIFAAVAVGAFVSRIGYLTPFAATGAALAAISSGLMSTFQRHTGAGKWIGYQILSGVGRGISTQQPVQAVQAVVPPALIPTATATIAWAQTFGAALILGLAQTAFLNLLRSSLHNHAPDVRAEDVIAAGATNYLASLTGQDDATSRTEVLLAYNEAVTRTFYLAVGCGVASFVSSLGLGRTKVVTKKKQKAVKADEETGESGTTSTRGEDQEREKAEAADGGGLQARQDSTHAPSPDVRTNPEGGASKAEQE